LASPAGHGKQDSPAQGRSQPTTEVSTVDFDKELDARGLSCPLPILKTKKSLNELTSGQVLKVVATDPGSVKDMQAFATQTGNPLLSTAEENKTYVFYLKKK
jgi:tRNA 2-thiouridine synthesizing protein A